MIGGLLMSVKYRHGCKQVFDAFIHQQKLSLNQKH